MPSYQHTQTGYVVLVALGTCTVATAILNLITRAPGLTWITVGILLVCALLFSSLTIEVNTYELKWWFGFGFIHKSIRIAEIEAIESCRTHWLTGWGIHLTRKGWLYNVSGLDAVYIRLKNGKRFLLGTDEPGELISAIESVILQNKPET